MQRSGNKVHSGEPANDVETVSCLLSRVLKCLGLGTTERKQPCSDQQPIQNKNEPPLACTPPPNPGESVEGLLGRQLHISIASDQCGGSVVLTPGGLLTEVAWASMLSCLHFLTKEICWA